MDHNEDDYPNFGNAFPSASSGAATASWHPALRENSEPATSDDDDFFQRYPGPTPKKGDTAELQDVQEQLEPDSPIRRKSISVHYSVNVTNEDASLEELQRVPSHQVEIQGPISHGMEEEDDEETPILEPGETVAEQELALEEHMPDALQQSTQEVAMEDQETENPAESPSEHYEHQGEVTEMEEAQEPSADAPLMDDEEPLPTPGETSREPTFGMVSRDSTLDTGAAAPQQTTSKSRLSMPPIDRSFTTNFSDSPIEQRQQAHSSTIPDDWPSVGDDKTFGELLDNQRAGEAEQAALQEIAAEESAREAAPDLDLIPENVEEHKEDDLAAAWGAALDDDDILEETPTDVDPSHFFGEDDDGFLEDELPVPAPVQTQPPQVQQQRNAHPSQYQLPNVQHTPPTPQHGMPSPQFFNQASHGRAAGTPDTGLFDVHDQVGSTYQKPQPRPTMEARGTTPSFSDKSKGGYQSPYDLPMEVVKPRRRPQAPPQQQPTPAQTPGPPPGPPPRTSSMGSQMGQPLPTAAQPKPPSVSSLSPPPSRGSGGSVPVTGPPNTSSAKSTPKTGSGFFEDLPIAAKPRARPAGSYTPQLGAVPTMPTPPPPPAGPMSPPRAPGPQMTTYQQSSPPQPTILQQPSGVNSYGGLRQPDRMPLLPDQPLAQPMQQHPPPGPPQPTRYSPSSQRSDFSSAAPPPAIQSRYSPAPTATQNAGSAPSRYSPAPAAQPSQTKNRYASGPMSTSAAPPPPAVQNANPFAPRTSSPLAAFTDKPHPPLPAEATRNLPPSSPPRVNGLQRPSSLSPESIVPSRYTPSERSSVTDQQFGPPLQRPHIQPPDTTMRQPKVATPASGGSVPTALPSGQPLRTSGPVLPHRRQFSRELSFAAPIDERSQDPLQRWKGYPIFNWGKGGSVLHSFPKQTPFYAAGQGVPSVKCTPGPITVQDANQFMPMDEQNAKFPGPLAARSKGRKKDVMAWLATKIQELERRTEHVMSDFTIPIDLKKRTEEKLILWKIMRVFVENDGVLEGNRKIDEEVRGILLPNLAQMAQVADLQSPASATVAPDAVDKSVLLQLRQALLEGQRERAVWLAEEKKLWGHAMLIASTMGPETWKQIVGTFVRSQVKSIGSDARSMAAMYQIFAGNSEECVDELVPPSARAGFQMINTADGTKAGNPLEGLDQWKETLGLVTSNRTPNDGLSLVALGKMLASYGRVEAAHTCYLFARAIVKHSGPDDADAHFVLLGANHQNQDENFGNDLDTIILTEVYEYATSLSAPSASVSYIPHLQAFKLVHGQQLAAYGLKSKASSYCDSITTAYTSTSRPSPYYHPTFTQAVADLSGFLSQAPHDGKSGLFTRPALKTVQSGAASWFSKFVTGDDDQESTGSGPGGASSDQMAGPFGGVNGDSPDLSRSGSGADLYNPMMGGVPVSGMSPPSSQAYTPQSMSGRYAPGASQGGPKYAPAQPYSGLGIPAAEPQRPGSSRYAPPPSHNLGVPMAEVRRRASDHSLPYAPSSRRGSAQETTSSQGSYEPRPILADESSQYSYSPSVQSPMVLPQQPTAVHEPDDDTFPGPNGLSSPFNAHEASIDAETGGGYEPPTGGYEPPSYSYQPYDPEPDSPEDAPKPKRKTYGDDEDEADMDRQSTALKKAQADREADEMFKKAAEADAARDQLPGDAKKGWFGGWFGKRDSTASPGPIKAKLGEENAFYYDENLKKWVNKKGGPEAATSAAPTPPPPKGPASRVASSAMGPPSGPPSRASSGSGLANMARPPTSGSGPAFSGPPSGPPSRVGTPSSNPPSDPGAPPSAPLNMNGDGGVGLAPPIRPASTLSNASSIDDLLAGPPGARKGGTVRKKKGRYVDVMAK